MKKIMIVCLCWACMTPKGNSQTYQDTANLIHTYIVNDSSKFIGKPLSVLFDSLGNHSLQIVEYLGLSNGGYKIDTLYTNEIELYFGPYHRRMLNGTIRYNTTSQANTIHVPTLIIHFERRVPFLDAWNWNDREGLGSYIWNEKLALYWGLFKVKSIEFEPE